MQVMLRKEAIQDEVKEQMELGEAGLLEEDQWMMEVNLGNLENTSGEHEEYWLLAIKAALREDNLHSKRQLEMGIKFTYSIQVPVWSGLEGVQ
jgi:hypothetical protein